mmetsp:Transcript_21607/g.56354  ORF Transcript_21607/g.56354 Transcript_21607/m.56354 type:complete len:272 (+) Transcript_21607:327-1142(+)
MVRSVATDSSDSSVSSMMSSSTIDRKTLLASILRPSSAPMNLTLPSLRFLYLNSAITRSSSVILSRSFGGCLFRSNTFWHSVNRSFLKLKASSAIGLLVKWSCSRTQRSVYILMKGCCVMAFSNTSVMRSSTWVEVFIGTSRICWDSVSYFSSVSLLRIDFSWRTTAASGSSSPPAPARRARMRAANEFGLTSSFAAGCGGSSRIRSSSRSRRRKSALSLSLLSSSREDCGLLLPNILRSTGAESMSFVVLPCWSLRSPSADPCLSVDQPA